MNYKGNYEDIINLPHHVSKKHKQMSLEARSAQFAPFSALTGFDDIVEETERITSKKIEINDEQKMILDYKLRVVKEKITQKPEITITYFKLDLKKSGGSYEKVTGNIERIDKYKHMIVLDNKIEIPILDIIEIEGEIFQKYGLNY